MQPVGEPVFPTPGRVAEVGVGDIEHLKLFLGRPADRGDAGWIKNRD